MLANNPAYNLEKEAHGLTIYLPTNIMEGYHVSRLVEANNQMIYANAGATKDVLELAMGEIINRCNEPNWKNSRTEVASIAQSIQYRLKYPVDNHCAVRLGCLLSFAVENDVEEDPDKCESFWLQKKEDYALKYPEWYSFFLTWGISNIPAYSEAYDISTGLAFFQQRKEAILSIWEELKQFKV